MLSNSLFGSDAASRRRLACRLAQRFQSDTRLFVAGPRRIFRFDPVPRICQHQGLDETERGKKAAWKNALKRFAMVGCFLESILGSLFGGANKPKNETERKVRRVMVPLVILFLIGLAAFSV